MKLQSINRANVCLRRGLAPEPNTLTLGFIKVIP